MRKANRVARKMLNMSLNSHRRRVTTTRSRAGRRGRTRVAKAPPRGNECSRTGLIHESIFDEAEEGRKTVPPTDFLPFVGLASRVGDGHLIDAVASLENLGGNLRLELKAARPQRDASDQISGNQLVDRKSTRLN